MKQYYAVWFSNGTERTARLIVSTDKYPKVKTGISEYSRLFPYSEAPKMKRCIVSSCYDSWQQCFDAEVKK